MKTLEAEIAGRVPVHRVWEDERHVAFLAARPVVPGHVILATRRVVAYVFELAPEEHAALWEAARRVAELLQQSLGCERVCVAVVGWEVRHVHVHLVPTTKAGQFPPLGGVELAPAELEWLAQRVRTGAPPTC